MGKKMLFTNHQNSSANIEEEVLGQLLASH